MLLEKLVIPIGFDTGLLLQGVDLIENAIRGVVDVAEQAIDRTRKWADDLDQLGDITGMSADKLGAWSFIATKAGVPVNSLARSLTILEKGLIKADGTLDTTGKALHDWGIEVKDQNGLIKDQSTLMNDIAKRYAEFGTQQERVNFLTEIFGRSGAELVDVFDTLANEGGIDAVTKKVGDLGLSINPDQYEQFSRNLNEIQLTLTGLAAIFTGPLIGPFNSIVNTFKEWLQTPWIAEGIAGISGKLGALFLNFNAGLQTGQWDFFWGNVEDIWQSLKKKLEGALQAGITWLTSNPVAITNFIDNLINALVTGTKNAPDDKLLELINTFISKIATQVASADWGKLDKALGDAMWKAAFNALDTVWAKIREALQQLWDYITKPVEGETGNPYPNATGKGLFGIPTYGKAGGGWAGGLTWVGERGPELVNLPAGSYVNNAQQSQQMAGGFDMREFVTLLSAELAKVIN